MNVLIIEDDLYLASQIRGTFLKYGFANRVEHISSYEEYIIENPCIRVFDIVLLDINLGKGNKKNGFDILSCIRRYNEYIPVIIISSHSGYAFLEEAFAKGANDYLIKPFRNRELQIRIERWFRNYIFSEYFSIKKTLEYKELIYDITAYEFHFKGNKIKLSKGSKYVLSLLMIYREKLITQDFLIEKIWGCSQPNYEKNLRIKLMRLKNQLKIHGIDEWVETIRGEGYRLKNKSTKKSIL